MMIIIILTSGLSLIIKIIRLSPHVIVLTMLTDVYFTPYESCHETCLDDVRSLLKNQEYFWVGISQENVDQYFPLN